ncbi:MAG: hypothetical protein HOK21_06660 [Rhodospirillaceae bacterium]|jgi:hypothetical protein|nr:hypothetical protein [Rhodospirillaceae bacterium]MBT4042203.1 hypothetical protein [Rhodospirillaceae bacterium]MBT4689457.1 hypothetical protein [Rhodospirillaceae bacterium]MBT5079750.1 hypothetical protein [Rhodospirillaceae bacterium]MBT5523747.1 hypothetical protein [Rhodospirillaceae bacterium]
MITNWYTGNIDPSHLSRRLRITYVLWLWQAVNNDDGFPSLRQIQSADLYDALALYATLSEGLRDADIRSFVYISSGAKVNERYSGSLASRRFDEVLTKPGQTLAEEAYAVMRKENRPVHIGVSGSPVLDRDMEAITLPLLHDDGAMELSLMVYDF